MTAPLYAPGVRECDYEVVPCPECLGLGPGCDTCDGTGDVIRAVRPTLDDDLNRDDGDFDRGYERQRDREDGP